MNEDNKNNPTPSSPTSLKFNEWKKSFYLRLKMNLWLFGFLGSFLVILASVIPYVLTKNKGYYNPIFPFISDSASFAPVANYFSQLLDFIVIIFLIIFWSRYKQNKYYINVLIPSTNSTNKKFVDDNKLQLLNQLNFISLLLTILPAFGLILIGNFRLVENTTVHVIGVLLLFGISPLMYIIQIYLIEQFYRCDCIETRAWSLIIFSIINTLSLLSTGMAGFIVSLLNGSLFIYWDNDFRLNNNNNNNEMIGYGFHLMCTISEWITVLTFSPIILSFSNRLRLFQHWDKVKF